MTEAMAASAGEGFNSSNQAFRKHCSDMLKAIQDPEALAWDLYAEKIISAAVRNAAINMTNDTRHRTAKLLEAVESQIKVNPRVFALFLSVLNKRPEMGDLCRRIKDTYDTAQNSDDDACAPPGHISPEETRSAHSHREELSTAADFALENRRAIDGKFAVLLTNVRDKMLKNGVDIETFRLFVVALFPPGDCIPPLPTDLTKIFEAITHHGLWGNLHYSPLVRIVRKFGAGDRQMKAWIKKHKKDVKAYAIVASIKDCIESNLATCTDQSQVDKAKHDPRYNCPVEWKTHFLDHSLQHLTNVWEMFSNHYLVPDSPPTALLDRVREGCVSVTWLVPSYLTKQLAERVEVDPELLQRYRIVKVTVKGDVVYQEEIAGRSTEDKLESSNMAAALSGEEQCHSSVQEETCGGYDCEFVKRPPRLFQTDCPICHLILRDPYEAMCCGYSFCYTCIQQDQRRRKCCPWCRKYNFEFFENVGMKRSINQLRVFCKYREGGCRWRGELGKLQDHLDKTDHSIYERPTNKIPTCQEDNESVMEWKHKGSLPVQMNSLHIVRIGNTVYCGGGFTCKVSTDRLVLKYDCEEDKWSQLPICPTLHFGLTQLGEKLVTVGGRDSDALTPIKDMYIFEEDSQTWKNSNKPLSTARCSPCAFAYKSVLVVCGGTVTWRFDYEHPERTDSVEVFQDSQWHTSVPLPFALCFISCAVVNDTCYIIGGLKKNGSPNRQVCSTSIPSLIQADLPESCSEASPSSHTWERHNCPLFFSTAAELDGHLLAIGGKDKNNTPSSAIHRYLPSSKSWEIIANGALPKPKYHAAAVRLEGGDIIIVGEKDKPGNMDKSVYIGSKPD